jgi:flagellar hook-associated protein 2
LQRINDSGAGVTATYDSVNDRFDLTNKTTGDVGISLEDVTGNFLAATGLSTGTLQRGTNLQYSINGGGTITSQSNTVSGAQSGVNGLSITALTLGITTISVGADTAKISSTISSFVTDYNAAQTFISTQIKPTTSSTGGTTPGVLTGDLDTEDIANQMRQFSNASPPGMSGTIQSLTSLGILSNGIDNTLSLTDTSSLTAALSNNLAAVKQLFTDPTNGIATKLGDYLTTTTGISGVLANNEASLSKQNTDIGQSITTLNQRLANDQTRLTNEFVAMETAINTINAQKQYLNQAFSGSSSNTQSAPTAAGSNVSSSSSSTG